MIVCSKNLLQFTGFHRTGGNMSWNSPLPLGNLLLVLCLLCNNFVTSLHAFEAAHHADHGAAEAADHPGALADPASTHSCDCCGSHCDHSIAHHLPSFTLSTVRGADAPMPLAAISPVAALRLPTTWAFLTTRDVRPPPATQPLAPRSRAPPAV